MKYSGVGGQAVMEGVMMRNGDRYAVSVRKPDQEIVTESFDYHFGSGKQGILRKIPIIRGVISFVDSLYLGMSSLMFSASFFEEEEKRPSQEEGLSEEERLRRQKKEKKQEDLMMGGTMVLAIGLAIVLFFIVPYLISAVIRRFLPNPFVLSLAEGIIRLSIFIAYIGLIGRMPDIKRTFMYHGAEHKCINCVEQGLDLTVENVRTSSRLHKRCGTSFLLIVMIISIFFFMFIRVESPLLRLGLRLLLIPVIAGVSFEFIRLAGRSENGLVDLISRPGLWMQKMTTSEPEDDMIEVAIASVNAVFDWRQWQEDEGIR